MFEKVNPSHPDKIADRIAGALVDYAYRQEENPKIAVEVLIGHGECNIVAETSVHIPKEEVEAIVYRIVGMEVNVRYREFPQDTILSSNQEGGIHCGDNGIFKGMPVTDEQAELSSFARDIYEKYPFDGKYILSKEDGELIVCQSNLGNGVIYGVDINVVVNPLGSWTGGINVDTGATNRKLGSDMGDAVTGGGLHGKDLSKADVSVNIFAHLLAQKSKSPVEMYCAIGDSSVNGVPYSEIVKTAREYIKSIGGFEKLAEWGLI